MEQTMRGAATGAGQDWQGMAFEREFLVIGHRGAAGLAPENTLASFRRAVELGVDAVELDVHVVDGEPVVIHDDTVDRTTDGTGALEDHGLAALRELDAGDGERIPLLEEVFEAVPRSVGINVELKGKGTGAVLADRLRGDGRPVLVSSFDRQELREFHARRPEIPCAPLHHRLRRGMAAEARKLDAWSVNVAEGLVDRTLVERLGAAGFPVLAYTVNDAARAAHLAELGARGVFTDFPDRIGRP